MSVAERGLLQGKDIARIQLQRPLQITQAFLRLAPPPKNVACECEDTGIIRQRSSGDLQFSQSSIIIEITSIKIFGASEVRFSRIRPQAECGLNRRFRQRQPRRSVVGAEEVKQIVRVSQLAVSEEKLRITRYRLVQQINSLQQILSGSGGETCRKNESLGATVEIERCDVRRERLLDRALFTRRKFCLELVGYSLRDLALNCKHVCEIAII